MCLGICSGRCCRQRRTAARSRRTAAGGWPPPVQEGRVPGKVSAARGWPPPARRAAARGWPPPPGEKGGHREELVSQPSAPVERSACVCAGGKDKGAGVIVSFCIGFQLN
jgi:hypothetical protein